MKQWLKRIFILTIGVVLIVLGVQQIVNGIQQAATYYEGHDKYVTVEGKVHSVYRFGLGYTAYVYYDYKGSGFSTYLERRIGFAPKVEDAVKIEVDSNYPIRVRPSSNGIFKILCGMIILAAIGYSMVVFKKYRNKEISINFSPKARKVVRIAGVILAAWIVANGVDVLVSSFFDARDFDWGLKLSVSDVSSKGLTLHLERNDTENADPVTYGRAFLVQKRTLIGWKELTPKKGYVFTTEGYSLKEMDSKSINIDFEGMFEKLSLGIYRIKKTTSVDGYYRYPEDEREELEQELYATFIIIW